MVLKWAVVCSLRCDGDAEPTALRPACARAGGLCGHIVCEVCDIDNEPLIEMVASSHHVETVVAHDVIGRLMIQSRRQPGLASVWEGILGFDDNEFYAARWPTLVGKRFSEVLVSFPDAIPVGLVQGTEHPKVLLNPHDDYELTEDDQLLVLAEDDDTYSPADAPQLAPTRPLPKYTVRRPLAARHHHQHMNELLLAHKLAILNFRVTSTFALHFALQNC